MAYVVCVVKTGMVKQITGRIMQSKTGNVKMFKTNEEALLAGYDVQLGVDELTALQMERLEKDMQPVVAIKDTRSKLGKRRHKANISHAEKRGSNFTPKKKRRDKR